MILAGFAVCLCLLVVCVYETIRRKPEIALKVAVVLVGMVAVYVFSNHTLIEYLLNSQSPSNREEYVLKPTAFSLYRIWDFFLLGLYDAASCHYYLALLDLIAFGCGLLLVLIKGTRNKTLSDIIRLLKWIGFGLLFAMAIAIFYVAFHAEGVIELREVLPGPLASFQFDRFYFLYPCIWYVVSGLVFEMLARIGQQRSDVVWAWIAILLTLMMTVSTIGKTSVVLINAKEVITGKESGQMTWREFYAEDLLREIKQDLDELSNSEDYRVISVGLHPAVAIYNGIATLDGYSTGYPLSYKHEFSKIIEGELDKSEELNDYFWDWGNRCYAFSHELGRRYEIPKDSSLSIKDFSMDVDALKQMGGRFIISAVPIERCEDYGLREVGSYESDDSFYELWAYEVE